MRRIGHRNPDPDLTGSMNRSLNVDYLIMVSLVGAILDHRNSFRGTRVVRREGLLVSLLSVLPFQFFSFSDVPNVTNVRTLLENVLIGLCSDHQFFHIGHLCF